MAKETVAPTDVDKAKKYGKDVSGLVGAVIDACSKLPGVGKVLETLGVDGQSHTPFNMTLLGLNGRGLRIAQTDSRDSNIKGETISMSTVIELDGDSDNELNFTRITLKAVSMADAAQGEFEDGGALLYDGPSASTYQYGNPDNFAEISTIKVDSLSPFKEALTPFVGAI